jgi:hypothetical protein
VTRRILSFAAVAVLGTALIAAAAAAADEGVGFGSLDPSSGPPGTEIQYRVVGSPNADSECRGSSAFSTEVLAADGVRLGTGGDTIAVPDRATPGAAFVRLICYVADATGRRVIRGVCTGFEITAAGASPGAPKGATAGSTIDEPCPASARVVVSQAVIKSQTALGEGFNQVITRFGG